MPASSQPSELEHITAAGLALFVRFVRMNPELSEADPIMLRTLAAYAGTELEPDRSLNLIVDRDGLRWIP